MSEFKFSCPHSAQHIKCHEEASGRQIECPACHHLIRIPPVPGKTVQYKPESGQTWGTFVPSGNVPRPSGPSRAPGEDPLAQATLRTHLGQLRAFDLPAALEMFHPSRRDTCFVALLRLGEGTATVTVGDGPRIEDPLEQVDALWTRDAVVWWLEPTASRGPDGEAWARQALAGRGHVDAELASAVSGFQLRAGLVPDGLLGTRTRMALFAMTPGSRPRLGEEGGHP